MRPRCTCWPRRSTISRPPRGASDALNSLEHRIAALSDALAERAQSGATVPPMLEALVQSLSDKIELIQQSRGDNVAVGHLEDRIVQLVERLDASDSRLGHLEAIERGLADLLVHIEDMRANKDAGGLRAEGSPGVDALKHDIARTQNALEAVHGTLGHVVDRLGMIEKDIRGEARELPPTPMTPSSSSRSARSPPAWSAMHRRKPRPRHLRRRQRHAPPRHRRLRHRRRRLPSACRRRAACRSIPICRPISRSSPAPGRRA